MRSPFGYAVNLCLSFALVMGSIALMTWLVVTIMGLREEEEIVIAFGGVLAIFMVFARTMGNVFRVPVAEVVKDRGRTDNRDEIRLMQELNQGLQRMEARVESLETILLDRERSAQGQAFRA